MEAPIVNLNMLGKDDMEPAAVLHIKGWVNFFLKRHSGANELMKEMMGLPWNKKAYMYGRIVNKKARHNLCWGSGYQPPDYENGKGSNHWTT